MKVDTEISIISESSSSVISINLNKLNQVKFVNLQLVSNFQMSSFFQISMYLLIPYHFLGYVILILGEMCQTVHFFFFFIIDSYV